ncbi:MAG: hypothetical protein M1829_002897 [Trizodia sp. TS-e1964]|nr:MAG: hypothetical protein M1829_002897 [Trizodia sp. TS-e1964]
MQLPTATLRRTILWQLLILASPAIASLPYLPTRAFLSPASNGQLAYVFRQSSNASDDYQLLSFNTSSSLKSSSIAYETISASLPFLYSERATAYTPFLDSSGNISVFAGDCSRGPAGTSLWKFSPEKDSPIGNGLWSKQSLAVSELGNGSSIGGSNFLATGLSFSPVVGGISYMYIFGGMCPNTNASSASSWTSSASYSNSMLTIFPLETGYSLGTSQSRGPPIAEAGYSITALQPSLSNSTNNVQTQKQSFVLLGGHTQIAFINMSSVALFSLPEQSWSFLSVSPPRSGRTDLALRDTAVTIDSRSGHAAVLSPDGKRIIVSGGWVGDISNPAVPQILILDIEQNYGGVSSWSWEIPYQEAPFANGGEGLYGHDSIMLPGGVMMIIGGYFISSTQSSLAKRSDINLNNNTYFYNTTSGTWISSYTNPQSHSGGTSASPADEGISSSKTVAIAAGVAAGVLAIIALICLYFWMKHRNKVRNEMREKDLQRLSWEATRQSAAPFEAGGIDGRGGNRDALRWMGSKQPMQQQGISYPWAPSAAGGVEERLGLRDNGATEAERTGLLVEIPSPTRGLRRSLHSRGRNGERLSTYQAVQTFDPHRNSLGTAGSIHPIDERDEYDENHVLPRPVSDPFVNSYTPEDPFVDYRPLKSHPVTAENTPAPSPERKRQLEIQNWVSDWTAADAIIHNGRSASPLKDDRTSSTLSDKSAVSALSQADISVGTMSRSISQRSIAFFRSSNPFSSSSNTLDPQIAGRRSPHQHQRHSRSQSFNHGSARPESAGAASFMTAATSFAQLQADGEILLPRLDTPLPESPGRAKGRPGSSGGGWMGSVRKALPFGGMYLEERRGSPEARSTTSSPTKPHRREEVPRRAASTSANYWKSKRGAADWDEKGAERKGVSRNFDIRDASGDEDWDVERAVESRVVQVMFTVPREKLRVVNGGAEEEIGSESGEIEQAEEVGEVAPAANDKGKGRAVDEEERPNTLQSDSRTQLEPEAQVDKPPRYLELETDRFGGNLGAEDLFRNI